MSAHEMVEMQTREGVRRIPAGPRAQEARAEAPRRRRRSRSAPASERRSGHIFSLMYDISRTDEGWQLRQILKCSDDYMPIVKTAAKTACRRVAKLSEPLDVPELAGPIGIPELAGPVGIPELAGPIGIFELAGHGLCVTQAEAHGGMLALYLLCE